MATFQVTSRDRKHHSASASVREFQSRDRTQRDPSARPVQVREFEAIRSQRASMAEPAAPSHPVTQEPVEYKEVQLNKRYVSKRVGKTIVAYPVDVKKGKVILKRDLEAKDSYTESRAVFDKYFVLDEV